MDERRDPQPAEGSARQPAVAGVARLSPVQQSYSDYAAHALACATCRDIDMPTCPDAKELWAEYERQVETARQHVWRC